MSNSKPPPKFKLDPNRFDYARDDQGKIRRAAKVKDNSVVRFKFLEGAYRWWRSRSLDTRFSLIPVGFALLATFIIYNASVFVYERQERALLKAQIPEEYSSKRQYERYKTERSRVEEYRKKKEREAGNSNSS